MRIQNAPSGGNLLNRGVATVTVALFLSMELFAYVPAAFAQFTNLKVQGGDSPKDLSRLIRDEEIRIPPELGFIDESFHGTSGKTIVYLQDAHDSLEAQENISKIINHLVSNYGVRTTFEEGYEGAVPTDKYFGFIKDSMIKEKVSWFFMDHLRIGGAEYAHINRTKEFNLIGADSLKLHSANIDQYRFSASKKDIILKDLRALEKEIKSLADSRFPKKFLEWLKTREQFDAKKLDLLTYLERTIPLLGRHGEEKTFGLMGFIFEAIRSGDPTVIEKAKHVDAREVFGELMRLEQAVAKIFLKNPLDKQLFEYSNVLGLLDRLNELQVSQEEYEAVKQSLKTFDTDSFIQFIFRQSPKTLILSRMWERNIKDAVQFYEIAQGRDNSLSQMLDEYFLENCKQGIPLGLQETHAVEDNKKEKRSPPPSSEAAPTADAPNPNMAVLVFGGFHKENIKRILEAKGISYAVVSPRITHPSPRHERFYKRLMTEGWLPYELSANIRLATRAPSMFEVGVANPELARAELRILIPIAERMKTSNSADFILAAEQALKAFARYGSTRSEIRDNIVPDVVRESLSFRSELRGTEILSHPILKALKSDAKEAELPEQIGSVTIESMVPGKGELDWNSPQAQVAIGQLIAAIQTVVALNESQLLGSATNAGKVRLKEVKKLIDRTASNVLRKFLDGSRIKTLVAAGEGEKPKPGEEESQPGIYKGEVYPLSHFPNDTADEPVHVAYDPVDGTTSAARGWSMAGTAPTVLAATYGARHPIAEDECFGVMGPRLNDVPSVTNMYKNGEFDRVQIEKYLRAVAKAKGKRLDQLKVIIRNKEIDASRNKVADVALFEILNALGVQIAEPPVMLEQLYVVPMALSWPGAPDVLMSNGLGTVEIAMCAITLRALNGGTTVNYTVDGRENVGIDYVAKEDVPTFQVIAAVREAPELRLKAGQALFVTGNSAVYRVSIHLATDAGRKIESLLTRSEVRGKANAGDTRSSVHEIGKRQPFSVRSETREGRRLTSARLQRIDRRFQEYQDSFDSGKTDFFLTEKQPVSIIRFQKVFQWLNVFNIPKSILNLFLKGAFVFILIAISGNPVISIPGGIIRAALVFLFRSGGDLVSRPPRKIDLEKKKLQKRVLEAMRKRMNEASSLEEKRKLARTPRFFGGYYFLAEYVLKELEKIPRSVSFFATDDHPGLREQLVDVFGACVDRIIRWKSAGAQHQKDWVLLTRLFEFLMDPDQRVTVAAVRWLGQIESKIDEVTRNEIEKKYFEIADSQSSEVKRGAVVRGLRFIKTPESFERMLGKVELDSSPWVQTYATEVIQYFLESGDYNSAAIQYFYGPRLVRVLMKKASGEEGGKSSYIMRRVGSLKALAFLGWYEPEVVNSFRNVMLYDTNAATQEVALWALARAYADYPQLSDHVDDLIEALLLYVEGKHEGQHNFLLSNYARWLLGEFSRDAFNPLLKRRAILASRERENAPQDGGNTPVILVSMDPLLPTTGPDAQKGAESDKVFDVVKIGQERGWTILMAPRYRVDRDKAKKQNNFLSDTNLDLPRLVHALNRLRQLLPIRVPSRDEKRRKADRHSTSPVIPTKGGPIVIFVTARELYEIALQISNLSPQIVLFQDHPTLFHQKWRGMTIVKKYDPRDLIDLVEVAATRARQQTAKAGSRDDASETEERRPPFTRSEVRDEKVKLSSSDIPIPSLAVSNPAGAVNVSVVDKRSSVRSDVRVQPAVLGVSKRVLVIQQSVIGEMTGADFKIFLILAWTNRSEIRWVVPDAVSGKYSNRVAALMSVATVDFHLPGIAMSEKIQIYGFSNNLNDTVDALKARLGKFDSRIPKRLTECFVLDGIKGIVLALLVNRPEELQKKNGLRYDGTGRFYSRICNFVDAMIQNYAIISTAA